jgi:hypothetical protein
MDEKTWNIRYNKAMIDCRDLIFKVNELREHYWELDESTQRKLELLFELLSEFSNGLRKNDYYDMGMIEFRVLFFKNEIKKLKRKVYEQIKNNSKR